MLICAQASVCSPRKLTFNKTYNSLSGRIGKMVASYEEGSGLDSRQSLQRFVLCKFCSEESAKATYSTGLGEIYMLCGPLIS